MSEFHEFPTTFISCTSRTIAVANSTRPPESTHWRDRASEFTGYHISSYRGASRAPYLCPGGVPDLAEFTRSPPPVSQRDCENPENLSDGAEDLGRTRILHPSREIFRIRMTGMQHSDGTL
jgi:hypothetical protein